MPSLTEAPPYIHTVGEGELEGSSTMSSRCDYVRSCYAPLSLSLSLSLS